MDPFKFLPLFGLLLQINSGFISRYALVEYQECTRVHLTNQGKRTCHRRMGLPEYGIPLRYFKDLPVDPRPSFKVKRHKCDARLDNSLELIGTRA